MKESRIFIPGLEVIGGAINEVPLPTRPIFELKELSIDKARYLQWKDYCRMARKAEEARRLLAGLSPKQRQRAPERPSEFPGPVPSPSSSGGLLQR